MKSKMTLAEALEGLTEDKFCTGEYARDANGEKIPATSKDATKWCVHGWLHKIEAGLALRLSYQVSNVAKQLGYLSSTYANDVIDIPDSKALA